VLAKCGGQVIRIERSSGVFGVVDRVLEFDT
jgi:hypothetical protein